MLSAKQKTKYATVRSFIETLESRELLSASASLKVSPLVTVVPNVASSTAVSGYTPAQIKSAYGFSSIAFNGVTGDGSGQTIAVVDAYSDPNIVNDLKVFDKQFSLTDPSFTQVSQTGSTTKLPTADAGWSQEISLDVEWAHAIAPKASIVLVDASSDSLKNLMAAVNYARNLAGVSVVSMSWGMSEFAGETSYDKYFTTPAGHIGVTFVAAAGDEGAAGGAEYPASSPNVLSVGGTTLSISSSGSIASESAWSDSSGGKSSYESTPTYQSGISATTRSTPDVSYNANPNTGYAVYDSFAYEGSVGWSEVGGTSAGAPQWGALVAIADQGRKINGTATLDGATGTLPAIYSAYASSATYAADFTDITSGSSSLGGGFGGGFGTGFGGGGYGGFGGWRHRMSVGSVSAATGYDTLTGLGTPKAAALVTALSKATVKSTATTATKTATAAVKTVKAKAAVVTNTTAVVLYQDLSVQPPTPAVSIRDEISAAVESDAVAHAASFSVGNLTPGVSTAAQGSYGLTSLGNYMTDVDNEQQRAFSEAVAAKVAAFVSNTSFDSAALRNAAQTFSSVTGAIGTISTDVFSSAPYAGAINFHDTLETFADESASLPASVTKPSVHGVFAVATAAAAADAVLVGYYIAKKRSKQPAVFNDETSVGE